MTDIPKKPSMLPTNRLFMTVGFPRSGKSSWALSQGVPIVNPDAVRLAIHGQAYIQFAEKFVWSTAYYMVRALFLAGHHEVILDACNNTEKRRDEWISRDGLWLRNFVVFDATAEECRTRLQNQDMDRNLDKAALLAAIDRMAEAHEPARTSESREGEFGGLVETWKDIAGWVAIADKARN